MQVEVPIGRGPHSRPCSDLFGSDAQPKRRIRNLKPRKAPRTDPAASWRRERRFDIAHHARASGSHPLRQLWADGRVVANLVHQFKTRFVVEADAPHF